MPYPNEISARQQDPKKYKKFRRKNNAFGDTKGVHAIYGITEDDKAELQSIRFSASLFTVKEARQWLKSHNFKYNNIEPATGKAFTKIRKGVTRLNAIVPNPTLEELVNQILEVTQEFYMYPDAPNTSFSKPMPWIQVPVYVGPYQREGEDFTGIDDKRIKQVRKARKNFIKGFGKLERTNKQMYTMYELSAPLDVVINYCNDLESYLLESRGN